MIDLHVHSNCSDGTLTPREIVKLAIDTGLSAFALTDHDTTVGVKEAKAAAGELASEAGAVQVISGTEISAAYKERDIHILGLFINEEDPTLCRELDLALAGRDRRNEKMVQRFCDLGIPMTIEDLRFENPDTVITRAHFAKYLMDKHIVRTRDEAFQKYLGYDAPCFVPRTYMEPEHAIRLILGAGGIPVLAHPLLYNLSKEELNQLLRRLTDAGLKGIEVFYSSFCACEQDIVRGLANHFGLLMTGGTDFHGSNKPNLMLGTGRNNNLNIPDSVLEPLVAFLNKNK